MKLDLDPPRAAGPITIGMPFSEAVAQLRTIEGYRERGPGIRENPSFAHYESGLSISIGFDARGLVDSIECYRPERNVLVLFGDIAVFDLPADDVIRKLRAFTSVEVEDEGLTVIAPCLLLAFGRPALPEGPEDPDGKFFETVLLSTPGYYDGPAGMPVLDEPSSVRSTEMSIDDRQLPLF